MSLCFSPSPGVTSSGAARTSSWRIPLRSHRRRSSARAKWNPPPRLCPTDRCCSPCGSTPLTALRERFRSRDSSRTVSHHSACRRIRMPVGPPGSTAHSWHLDVSSSSTPQDGGSGAWCWTDRARCRALHAFRSRPVRRSFPPDLPLPPGHSPSLRARDRANRPRFHWTRWTTACAPTARFSPSS